MNSDMNIHVDRDYFFTAKLLSLSYFRQSLILRMNFFSKTNSKHNQENISYLYRGGYILFKLAYKYLTGGL